MLATMKKMYREGVRRPVGQLWPFTALFFLPKLIYFVLCCTIFMPFALIVDVARFIADELDMVYQKHACKIFGHNFTTKHSRCQIDAEGNKCCVRYFCHDRKYRMDA